MTVHMDVDEVDPDETSQNESEEERDETQMDETSDNGEEEEADDDDDEHDDDLDGEEEDDEDEDGEEEDDEDEDEDEDDDDEADNGSPKPKSPTPAVSSSPLAYVRAAKARVDKLIASSSNARPDVSAYQIEPVGAAPHSAHVHAMALSADGTNLITGGSDGHVRRYDVYASMNGKVPLTQNVRHQYVDGITRSGVMTAWWACEEVPRGKAGAGKAEEDEDDDEDDERLVSPVYSLAVQQDALWCLSGTESGNINLTSLRHDTGRLRHVLRKHTAAVSAMALTNDDTVLISGGWDRGLHQWDLHTGQVVRSYPGHAAQISSIAFRPLQQNETWSNAPSPRVVIRPSAASRAGSEAPVTSPPAHSADHKVNTEEGQNTMVKGTSPTGMAQANGDGPAGPIVIKQSPSSSSDVEMVDAKETQETTEQGHTVEEIVANGTPASLVAANTPMAAKTPSSMLKDASQISMSTPSKRIDGDDNLFGDADGEGEEQDKLDEALGLGALQSALDKGTAPHNMMDVADDEVDGLRPSEPVAPNKDTDKAAVGDDSDGDSLFGGISADGSADADGEADAEGEADDLDAEGEDDDGEDDDAPLAARVPRPYLPLGASSGVVGNGLDLPQGKGEGTATAATSAIPPATAATTNGIGKAAASSAADKAASGTTFAATYFDGDVAKFSNDVMLTTTLGGQVILWDRRVPSYPGSSSQAQSSSNGSGTVTAYSGHKGVRALALPDRTPPWCMSACWNRQGDRIYVGRRNETIDEWDLRMLPDQVDGAEARLGRSNARFVRSLRLPYGSGPVSSVMGMPNGRHLVCASYDNVRLWDTAADPSMIGGVPFRIVAGHHGATVSQMLLDPTCRFLLTASGDRGWMSTSTESVILHEVRATF